jgi:hypothetical protein
MQNVNSFIFNNLPISVMKSVIYTLPTYGLFYATYLSCINLSYYLLDLITQLLAASSCPIQFAVILAIQPSFFDRKLPICIFQ